MSLLQRIDVYQKADHYHPAFRPSRVINREVRLLERAAPAAHRQVITEYVDSEKWCGDQRTKYAAVKVEAISFVLAVIVALAVVVVSVMFPDEFSLIGP